VVKKISFIVLMVLLLQGVNLAAQPVKATSLKAAPGFSLLDLNSKQVSLSDFKNKDVILFFWTTWCPYCVREIKTLSDKYQALTKDGVALLLIDVGEPKYKVDNFVKRNNLGFGVLLDEKTRVAESYRLMGIPTFVLIDKKGMIRSIENRFPQDYKAILSE
jgi:peroxiredoxin